MKYSRVIKTSYLPKQSTPGLTSLSVSVGAPHKLKGAIIHMFRNIVQYDLTIVRGRGLPV